MYTNILRDISANFQLGSTAIGIQTQEGVVLVVEKRVTSPLIVPSSIEKIMEIDTHIGIVKEVFTLDLFFFIVDEAAV